MAGGAPARGSQNKALAWTDLAGGSLSEIAPPWEKCLGGSWGPEVSAHPISALGPVTRQGSGFWQGTVFWTNCSLSSSSFSDFLALLSKENSCHVGWKASEWCQKGGIVWICPYDPGKRKQNGKGKSCTPAHLRDWLPSDTVCPRPTSQLTEPFLGKISIHVLPGFQPLGSPALASWEASHNDQPAPPHGQSCLSKDTGASTLPASHPLPLPSLTSQVGFSSMPYAILTV